MGIHVKLVSFIIRKLSFLKSMTIYKIVTIQEKNYNIYYFVNGVKKIQYSLTRLLHSNGKYPVTLDNWLFYLPFTV